MNVAFLPLLLAHLGIEGPASLAGWTAAAFGGGLGVSTVATPLWGALGDRIGRRAMALRAATALALVQILFVFAETPEQVVGIRLLQGAISGVHPALTAWAATATPRDRLGKTLGLLESIGSGAAMLAPLAAAGLMPLGGFPLTYATGAALAASAIPLLLLTAKAPGVVEEQREATRGGIVSRLRGTWNVPGVRGLLLLAVAAEFPQALVEVLYPVLVVQLCPDPSLQALVVGLVEVVGEGAYLLAAPFFGRAIDRFGTGPILRGSLFASGLATLSLLWIASPWLLLPLAAVSDGASAGIHPGIYARLARIAPASSLGTAVSLAGSAVRAGGAAGVARAAPLVAIFGLGGAFVGAGLCLLLSAWGSQPRKPTISSRPMGEEAF
jgi:MFS family permease